MPYRKGNQWIAQVREGDRRVQKVFQSKKPAQEWESEQRKIPSENWLTRSGYSVGALANDYLEHAHHRFSDKTFREKHSLFKRYFRHMDHGSGFKNISPDDIRRYLQSEFERRGGNAANKDRKNLLSFFSWVARYKGLINTGVAVCERFPEQRSPRYVPPEEDFWKVFEMRSGQDRTMLLAYLHLAARRAELFRLRWDDVDFDRRQIRLFTRKRMDGSMAGDWLPMTDELFAALEAHRLFVGGDLVFPGPGGREYKYRIHTLEAWCKKAGVRKFGWHAIRHLSGSILAQAGVPAIHIQGILRHRQIATTERYLHRLTDIRGSMEKAFLKAPNVT